MDSDIPRIFILILKASKAAFTKSRLLDGKTVILWRTFLELHDYGRFDTHTEGERDRRFLSAKWKIFPGGPEKNQYG